MPILYRRLVSLGQAVRHAFRLLLNVTSTRGDPHGHEFVACRRSSGISALFPTPAASPFLESSTRDTSMNTPGQRDVSRMAASHMVSKA